MVGRERVSRIMHPVMCHRWIVCGYTGSDPRSGDRKGGATKWLDSGEDFGESVRRKFLLPRSPTRVQSLMVW